MQKPLTFRGDLIVGAAAAAAKDQQTATPEARIVGVARVAGEAPVAVDAVTVPGK